MRPISIRDANAYVARWHRHSYPVAGAPFALSAFADESAVEPIGVVIVGRPKARRLQDGVTAEVVRLATDGTRDCCSYLYARAKRAAQALGYTRVITYTLATESGASLRAIGAEPSAAVAAASWDTPSRPRTDKHKPAERVRWNLTTCPATGQEGR